MKCKDIEEFNSEINKINKKVDDLRDMEFRNLNKSFQSEIYDLYLKRCQIKFENLGFAGELSPIEKIYLKEAKIYGK